MPNPPQAIPAGMYQGGEMLVTPYPPGGAVGIRDPMGMAYGGAVRQYAADPGEYQAPETGQGGMMKAFDEDTLKKALKYYRTSGPGKPATPDPSMNREPVGAYGNPNFAMGGEARAAPIRSQSQALAYKEMMASMPPPPTQSAPRGFPEPREDTQSGGRN